MKFKVSPAVIGAFVIGAFALAFFALLSFGGISFFSKPQRFVVHFDESIHGLDLGSAVKLRGVRVGRVVDLNLHYDEASKKNQVVVLCEINRDMIKDDRGTPIDISDRNIFQGFVDQGLRAKLGVVGLATGLLFVELEFLDPRQYPDPHIVTRINHVVVPAVPSAISEFQASLSEILSKVRRVDFEGIAKEVKLLLVDTRRQMAEADLKGVTDQWKKTGASVEALATSPELKQTITNLNAASGELRAVLVRLDGQVGAGGTGLQAALAQAKVTLESFHAAAEDARKFISAQSGLGADASHALRQLADAAVAVQRLADYLERNPGSIVAGRPSADKPGERAR